jgi:hypothetical protein
MINNNNVEIQNNLNTNENNNNEITTNRLPSPPRTPLKLSTSSPLKQSTEINNNNNNAEDIDNQTTGPRAISPAKEHNDNNLETKEKLKSVEKKLSIGKLKIASPFHAVAKLSDKLAGKTEKKKIKELSELNVTNNNDGNTNDNNPREDEEYPLGDDTLEKNVDDLLYPNSDDIENELDSQALGDGNICCMSSQTFTTESEVKSSNERGQSPKYKKRRSSGYSPRSGDHAIKRNAALTASPGGTGSESDGGGGLNFKKRRESDLSRLDSPHVNDFSTESQLLNQLKRNPSTAERLYDFTNRMTLYYNKLLFIIIFLILFIILLSLFSRSWYLEKKLMFQEQKFTTQIIEDISFLEYFAKRLQLYHLNHSAISDNLKFNQDEIGSQISEWSVGIQTLLDNLKNMTS